MKHYINESNSTNSEYHTFIEGNKKIKIRLSDHSENFTKTDADYFYSLSEKENIENIAAEILSKMNERTLIKVNDFIEGVRYDGLSFGLNSEIVNYSVVSEKKYPAEKNKNNPNLIKIYFDENQNREMALVRGYKRMTIKRNDFEKQYNVICK